MIKYGLVEGLGMREWIDTSWTDIIRYNGQLYRILIADKNLGYLVEKLWKRQKDINGKILQFSISEDYKAIQWIELIENIKSKNEYQRINQKRKENYDQALQEFQAFLEENDVKNAIDLVNFTKRDFRPIRWIVSNILGKTVYYDVVEKDLLIFMDVLWRDIIGETKELLQQTAGVQSSIDLLDYGRTKFLKTFGQKIISFINTRKNEVSTDTLLEFAEHLWWYLKDDLKNLLWDEFGIDSYEEFIQIKPRELFKYKKYFWKLISKTLNYITVGDMVDIGKKIFPDRKR